MRRTHQSRKRLHILMAISAILSEVKALKEQVTTLKESVELVAADPEVEESLMDGNNDDSESLSTRVARFGSSPAEQIKDGTKSLLQDIASELDLSEGLAKIVLSLLKDKHPEEKSQARIDKYSRPENVEGLRTPRINTSILKKILKTVEACKRLQNMTKPLISEVAERIGLIVSNFPAVQFGTLHYRFLERDKTPKPMP